jgi:hypothetical protein
MRNKDTILLETAYERVQSIDASPEIIFIDQINKRKAKGRLYPSGCEQPSLIRELFPKEEAEHIISKCEEMENSVDPNFIKVVKAEDGSGHVIDIGDTNVYLGRLK